MLWLRYVFFSVMWSLMYTFRKIVGIVLLEISDKFFDRLVKNGFLTLESSA